MHLGDNCVRDRAAVPKRAHAARAARRPLAVSLNREVNELSRCGAQMPSIAHQPWRYRVPLLEYQEDSELKVDKEASMAEENEAAEGKVDAWGRPIAESKFKIDFDFGGGTAKPATTRGQNGKNEQGYDPYEVEVASKPADSTYIVLLGVFAAAFPLE